MTTEEVQRMTEIEQRARSNTKRIDALEHKQDDLSGLVTAVCGMKKDIEYTQQDVAEMKGDIKSLVEKPANRWEAVVKAVITAVVSGLAGAALVALLK